MIEKTTPAKRALQSVEEVRSQVGRLRRSVKAMESRCGPAVSHWNGSGGKTVAGPNALMEALLNQQMLLDQEEKRLQKLEATIEQWINLLPHPRWRMVLRCYYLDGMELGEIARELTRSTGREFSTSQVYRFHRKALEAADRMWPLS